MEPMSWGLLQSLERETKISSLGCSKLGPPYRPGIDKSHISKKHSWAQDSWFSSKSSPVSGQLCVSGVLEVLSLSWLSVWKRTEWGLQKRMPQPFPVIFVSTSLSSEWPCAVSGYTQGELLPLASSSFNLLFLDSPLIGSIILGTGSV